MTTAAQREREDNARMAEALSFPDPSLFVHDYGGARRERLSPRQLAEVWADARAPEAAWNLYLHVPYCKSICSFCNYTRLRVSSQRSLDDYVSFIASEAQLFAPALEGVEFGSVYVGGGTPSVLSAEQLTRLFTTLHDTFRFAPGAQKNFEYDPMVMTPNRMEVLAEFGFNRFSFGIQSTDVGVNELHNRGRQGARHIARQFELLEGVGPSRVNVDFLMGLDGTTPEGMVAEIEQVLRDHQPDEVSIYFISPTPAYVGAHFGGDFARYERFLAGFESHVPQALREVAARVGYAVPGGGKHLIRMQRTTHRAGPSFTGYYCDVPSQAHRPLYVFGLGDSARSRIFGRLQYRAEHDTDDRAPDSRRYVGIRMSEEDEVFSYVSYVLRDGDVLDRARFRRTFGVDIEERCGEAVAKLVELGVATVDEAGVTLVHQRRRERLRDLLFFLPPGRRKEAAAIAERARRQRGKPTALAPEVAERLRKLLGAARLLLGRERPHDALRLLDRAIELEPGSAVAWLLLAEVRHRLDWLHGSLEAFERALELHEERGRRVALARQYLELGAPDRALRLTSDARRAGEEMGELAWIEIEALIALRNYDSALEALDHVAGPAERRAEALLACGSFEALEREDSAEPAMAVVRAEAALRSGHTERARALAAELLEPGGASSADKLARAHAVLASAHLCEGALEEADRSAVAAIEIDAEASSPHLVRATVARRRGDLRAAFQHLHAARQGAREYLLALDLTELACVAASARGWREDEEAVADLARRAPALCEGGVDCERAFDALSGNFSVHPTAVIEPGRTRRLSPLPDPRSAAMDARRALRVVGFESILELYGELLETYAHHPLVHTHRGELYMWTGRYEEAIADFEAALEGSARTVWAYIGLALARSVTGDPEAALEVLDRAAQNTFVGPTTPVVRGEALRLLGRDDEARADLVRAVEDSPGRISAWVNLALVAARAGQRGELRRCLRAIAERAPSLLRDLAHDRGRGLSLSDPDALVEDLEHSLRMMRGNRSSRMVTYYTADGVPHVLDT